MPKSKDARATKLTQAIALVLEVQMTLDISEDRCGCCEIHKYLNWEEAKLFRNLESAVTRITRARQMVHSLGVKT